MEVQLTDDQKAFVRQAVESGRYRHEAEAFQDAFSLWEEREGRREEILASLDEAEASLARGEGRRITTLQQMQNLSDQIKQRGMARFARENNKG